MGHIASGLIIRSNLHPTVLYVTQLYSWSRKVLFQGAGIVLANKALYLDLLSFKAAISYKSLPLAQVAIALFQNNAYKTHFMCNRALWATISNRKTETERFTISNRR